MPLEPEARLPITKLAAIVLPVGMFWFAWTVQPSVHFILPILALAPFGVRSSSMSTPPKPSRARVDALPLHRQDVLTSLLPHSSGWYSFSSVR